MRCLASPDEDFQTRTVDWELSDIVFTDGHPARLPLQLFVVEVPATGILIDLVMSSLNAFSAFLESWQTN